MLSAIASRRRVSRLLFAAAVSWLCALTSTDAFGATAYVSNIDAGTVTVFDVATRTPVTTVTTGGRPGLLAATATHVYVPLDGGNQVSVIEVSTGVRVETITVGTSPSAVAVNPAGTRAYVSNFNSHTVSVIDTAGFAVIATVSVANGPSGLVVHPDGSRVYVTSQGSNSVQVIDTSSNTVTATISGVGALPRAIALSPTGSRAYVADLDATVTVIDTALQAVITTITLPSEGRLAEIAVNPSGTRVYAVHLDDDKVFVIDTLTNAIVTSVAVGDFPRTAKVTPDGAEVWVTNGFGDSLTIIAAATNTVTAVIPTADGPHGLAFVGSTAAGPRATNDSYTTAKGTVLDTAKAGLPSVLANDVNDTEGDLTAVLVGVEGPGSVALQSSGHFVYVPPAHFHGTARFTYRAVSDTGQSNVATVTITVFDVNHRPVAHADSYTTTVDTPLGVEAPGLLENDTDADGDTLVPFIATPPTNGVVILGDDGSFTYTPNAGFTGTDTFTYTVDDGRDSDVSTSLPAIVTIKVNNPAHQDAAVTNFSPTQELTLTITFNAIGTDSFVIRPTDFFKHWHCRLFRASGDEVDPQSVHGAPGTTLQLDGDPNNGDLDFIPANTTKTYTVKGNLKQVFPKIDNDNFMAQCTAENSITVPSVDPATGQCPDGGDECLSAPVRTYVTETAPFDFNVAQGATTVPDQCPSLAGNAAFTGCPFADAIEVILNRRPLRDVVARVFDRNSTAFQAVAGGRTPPASAYGTIYEQDKGRVAACVTRPIGLCVAGLTAASDYLVIVKFTNPITGAPDYAGALSSRFVFNIAGTLINIRR